MLEMSWIIAILQLYSQVADLFANVIVKRINIRLFDLLARFHYILNLPRIEKKNGIKNISNNYRNNMAMLTILKTIKNTTDISVVVLIHSIVRSTERFDTAFII